MTTQHPDTPETGITPGGTSGAFRDVLSKDHARRGRPPLHFVDMTPEQRVEKAAELGLPKFRVKQLANHYFGHFDVNAAEFTDFPAAKRSEAAAGVPLSLGKTTSCQSMDLKNTLAARTSLS